jgi:hypothetical protein
MMHDSLADLLDDLRRPTGAPRGSEWAVGSAVLNAGATSQLESIAERFERAEAPSRFGLSRRSPALVIEGFQRDQEIAAVEWLVERLQLRLYSFGVRELAGDGSIQLRHKLAPLLDGRTALVHLAGIEAANAELAALLARRSRGALLVASLRRSGYEKSAALKAFTDRLNWGSLATVQNGGFLHTPSADSISN